MPRLATREPASSAWRKPIDPGAVAVTMDGTLNAAAVDVNDTAQCAGAPAGWDSATTS